MLKPLYIFSLFIVFDLKCQASVFNVILPASGGNLESYTSQYSSSYSAAKLTDGTTNSAGWCSTKDPNTQEFVWSFDNGETMYLTGVVIYSGTGGNENKYWAKAVQIWTSDDDGSSYTLAGSGTVDDSIGSTTSLSIASSGLIANRVKLRVTSGYESDYWCIGEVAIFGVQSTPSPSPRPTHHPTPRPTSKPSPEPTPYPTSRPSRKPSPLPTPRPTLKPSTTPTDAPTLPPTRLPTYSPTLPPTPLPTEPPTLVPTSLPTKPPTLLPTPSPSPVPTLVPSVTHYPTTSTGQPSPLPTVRPSLVPTPVPTLPPTPQPTTAPTALPSLSPTTLPTLSLHPSSLPTIEPTQIPTPSPTLSCPNGSVFSLDDNSCEVCGIGYFSIVTPNNPRPSTCTLCPVGKYSITIGAKACLTCDVGKLSSDDRASCRDCAAGEYNNNGTKCTKCERGKYAPTAQNGVCLDCNAGDYTNNATGATTCSSCDAGRYSKNLAISCIDCPKGKSSFSRAGNCTECVPGKYSNETAAGSCTSCDAGKYSVLYGAYECNDCPTGTNQPSTGQFLCLECSGGKYAASAGSLGCTTCANGYDSPDGASSCELAATDYFLLPNSDGTLSTTTSSCPEFMSCYGSDHAPAPNKGYWVDRSSFKFIKDVYLCPRKTCLGGQSRASCWNYANYTEEQLTSGACAQDTLLCDEGSKGPLCGSCDTKYIFKPIKRVCEPCQQAVKYTFVTAFVGGTIVAVGVFLFGLGAHQEHAEKKRLEREAGTLAPSKTHPNHYRAVLKRIFKKNRLSQLGGAFARHVDPGSLKVIWVTFQIIMSCSWNLDIEYPSPFDSMLGFLNFMSLDFLSIECLQSAKDRYYTTVYLWSFTPIAVTVLIFAVLMIRISIAYSKEKLVSMTSSSSSSSSSSAVQSLFARSRSSTIDGSPSITEPETFESIKRKMIAQHVYSALLLSYLVLPPVALKHFQSLDCIPFHHDGSSYLRVDTSISCESHRYLTFRAQIIVFIILYQSIPIVWFTLLYKQRKQLHQRSQTDVQLALFVRDQDKEVDALRFLFNDYLPNRWWFEVVEIYRRTMFVGILPLMSPQSSVRASVGIIFAVASIAFYREEQPFRVPFTNIIAYVAQYVILLVYYGGFSLATGNVIDFGLNDLGMGIFLSLIVLFVFGLVIYLAITRMQKELQDKQLIANNAMRKAEDASSFSANKFQTTFRAIFNTAVPATHVLGFHYTSAENAKKCQRCGISSHLELKAVIVSLRGPHQLTDSEKSTFESISDPNVDNFEAVVVVSLPARMLVPVPGIEDSSIRMLPSGVLLAMRPTAFTALFDPGPSLRLSHAMPHSIEGPCILPPTCIERVYILKETGISDELEAQRTRGSSIVSGLGVTGFGSGPSLTPKASAASMDEPAQKLANDTNMPGINPMFEQIKRNPTESSGFIDFLAIIENVSMQRPKHISEFCLAMAKIRAACKAAGLVPLYHYTNPSLLKLILRDGFRMSTQGQGDGGVYFSTLGPCSYGLSTFDYEENLIRDCFGAERIAEYKGEGRLTAVFVYACHPSILQPAPGGRDKAKVVSKPDFSAFSLPHVDGNYFLRPDRIMGVFYIDPNNQPLPGSSKVSKPLLAREIGYDLDNIEIIRQSIEKHSNVFDDVMELSTTWLLARVPDDTETYNDGIDILDDGGEDVSTFESPFNKFSNIQNENRRPSVDPSYI